jgi:hypothetical protein
MCAWSSALNDHSPVCARLMPARMVNAALANDVMHARKFPLTSDNIVNIQQKIARAASAR